MTDKYGARDTEHYGWGTGVTQAYMSATLVDVGGDVVRLGVTGAVQSVAPYSMAQYGVMVQAGQGGGNGTAAGWQDAGGVLDYQDWVGWPTFYADFSQLAYPYTVTVWTKYWGETVSGYGPCSNAGELSMDMVIPARPLRPPSAPSGLVAQRTGAGVIDVTWTDDSSNATATYVERQEHGEEWEVVSSQQSVVTSYADTVSTGTYRYRVRHANDDGYSGYSNESEWVTALCAPAAPTITYPASGQTLSTSETRNHLDWRHNTLDTSAQAAAQVQYTTYPPGYPGPSTTRDVSGDTATIPISTTGSEGIVIPSNSSFWARVRTKGAYGGDGDADAAWSPWSEKKMFLMRTPPAISVSVDSTITAVPIDVSWDYEDAQGTQASATVTVTDALGRTAFSAAAGTAASYEIPAGGFTPSNGEAYVVTVEATSTTSLRASGTAGFAVAYDPPGTPSLSVLIDDEAASATISVFAGPDGAPASSFSVFRDGTLVASGLQHGWSCTDHVPPLDAEVAYRVVAYAPSGAVADAWQKGIVRSHGFAHFRFGDESCRMRAALSASDSARHERVLMQVAGSILPKAFYGEHVTRSGSVSADVDWLSDLSEAGQSAMLAAFRRLRDHNGPVTMRLPYYEVLRVACDVSIDISAERYNRAAVGIDWEAVA